jgi:hypothetical protein
MNPYSIEGWVSRIEDRKCREFFLNSLNYIILKNKVCNSFSEAFLKNRFNDDSFRYNYEGEWYWKLKNGEIAISNSPDLSGDVTHFFETGRVIQKSNNRTGTLVESSSFIYNIVKWDKSNRFGSGVDRFEDVKSELEWLTVIKDNSISPVIRKPGSVLTTIDIGARVSRNPHQFMGSDKLYEIGTVVDSKNGSIAVRWDNNDKDYTYFFNQLIYADIQSENIKSESMKDNSISSVIRKPGSVLTTIDIGARVSRNPHKFIGSENLSVIGTITSECTLTKNSKKATGVRVKWDNVDNTIGQSSHTYYIEELIYAFGKSVNSVIVPNILPTIKKGEIPTGIILKPKTKKSIVINNNLQFRKVVV